MGFHVGGNAVHPAPPKGPTRSAPRRPASPAIQLTRINVPEPVDPEESEEMSLVDSFVVENGSAEDTSAAI